MASPLKKPSEAEWKAMKVMLPITKQGVTGTRAVNDGKQNTIFVPTSILSRNSID
jgi:hypothetical protein